MLNKTTLLSILSFLSSCAPMITYLPEKHVVVVPSIQSPSDQISEFKSEGEKADLSLVIAEQFSGPEVFLKDVNNKNVQFWIEYFGKREKERFERFLNNGEKYKKIIEETFEDYGLPKELYYVGLIESGYNLSAKSHANAVGPWQFIKSTAKRYGLTVNSKIDERKNIHKSTKAAALFFQDLYNIFGSWELALSAYNAGEYGIIRRIRNANTRDYYKLSEEGKLPKETIHYVPKVLAAIEISKDPKKFNINIKKQSENIFENTKILSLKNSYSLKNISKVSGIKIETLQKLNPDLHTPYTPKFTGNDYEIVVPNSTNSFESNLSPIKQTINTVTNNIQEIYLVKKGDNLYSIARDNHTSVTKIMQLNSLTKKTIYSGQKLKLPMIDKTIYTVKRGDYLGKIAEKYGLSLDKIKELNSMRRSKIFPGQRLIVSTN